MTEIRTMINSVTCTRVDQAEATAMLSLQPPAFALRESVTVIMDRILIESVSVQYPDTVKILTSVSELIDFVYDLRDSAVETDEPFAHFLTDNETDQRALMIDLLALIDYSV